MVSGSLVICLRSLSAPSNPVPCPAGQVQKRCWDTVIGSAGIVEDGQALAGGCVIHIKVHVQARHEYVYVGVRQGELGDSVHARN